MATSPNYDKNSQVVKSTGPRDVGTNVVVGVGDAAAAKKRRDQIIAGTQNVEQAFNFTGGGFTGAGYKSPTKVPTGPAQVVDTERTKELRRQAQDAELSRINREIDLTRGRERGNLDFYSGALGRVSENLSPELQQIQNARMDMATNGYGAQAFQAAREQRLQGLQRDQQAQQRALRGQQGATGVFGALGGAQTQLLMDQQNRATQEAERKLFLDEVNQRQQSYGLAEQTVRGNRADTLGREQYNLAQNKAEIMGRLTAQYGEAALGVAERSSAASTQAAKDYAQAVRDQGTGGKK